MLVVTDYPKKQSVTGFMFKFTQSAFNIPLMQYFRPGASPIVGYLLQYFSPDVGEVLI